MAARLVSSPRLRSRAWFILPILLFGVSAALTSPPFIGDTEVYAHQVEQVHSGTLPGTALWECGHILWRPLAYLLSPIFLRVVPDGVAWSQKVKIIYGLISINLICTAFSVAAVFDLSRRILGRLWPAMVAAVLFVWGDAVLAYSQSGSSYCIALALLVAGIWWQMVYRQDSLVHAAGPGILIGLAALFWLPFVLVIPAAACAGKFAPLPDGSREDVPWLHVIVIAGAAAAMVLTGLAAGAALGGVRSASDFLAWFTASKHEWSQNRQWIRAISGCARLFIDLGNDGVFLKRFTFKDPYNPVSALDLFRYGLGKIALFYAFLASIGWLASRSLLSRRSLAVLLLAAVPVLFFAVFLFEPSSPERFLPALPFLLITLAAAWDAPGRATPVLRGVVLGFAMLLPVVNWPTFAGSFSPQRRRVHAQIADFRAHAGPRDVLVAVSAYEPLFQTVINPLDPMNRTGEVTAYALVNASARDASLWRARFAGFVLNTWNEGRDIWIAKAGMAGRPESGSLWVEGDNPAVRWPDVAAFLHGLEFDGQTRLPDGFVRLRHSAAAVVQFDRLRTGSPMPPGSQGGF